MQAFLKGGKITTEKKPSKSNVEKKTAPTPWVEKYRPKSVDDVVEQGEVIAVLKKCLSGADLPNLLLYGPPGTGKTSTILAAARQLFGDIYKDRILELNASDERGIHVIRSKVKTFSQLSASATRPDGKPCPPFKIIILDEADSMTHAAQSALRRTMEKETKTTRFCLICNYVSRIIPPLTSRCTKFRFKPLGEEKVIERLNFISAEENITISEGVLKTLAVTSGGDMRRAITCLQSCSRLRGKDQEIRESDMFEVTGLIPDRKIVELLEVCKTSNYSKLEDFVEELNLSGYSIAQFFEQFNEYLVNTDGLTNKQKAMIGKKLGECCYRLEDGGSESLQMMDLGCHIILSLIANE
ncbi:replication factor C subunit 4-like [Ctenocephalides felis]|uniref:replication factor C subunit 4-like n=1 Tax=Ctenocephalides felis TaxID=7515 RepID=UPI000E6E3ECC|nr:replication factor C subunit 4-like [Ctenocephalides felis]